MDSSATSTPTVPELSTDDPVTLTRQLVDIPSVSGDEQAIADAVEAALRGAGHLEVQRIGHTVVARTHHGRADRVVLVHEGQAVAVGTHRELLAKEPRYRAVVTRETDEELSAAAARERAGTGIALEALEGETA